MKKIYIRENQINKDLLLPKFLYKAVRAHDTSLGDNPAFPSEDDYAFDYTILKDRYRDVCDKMHELGMPTNIDIEKLKTMLSELVVSCKRMEAPIKDSLEKICENTINRIFAIPDGAVEIQCKLVDKISYEIPASVTPEVSTGKTFKFKGINDFELSKSAVAKRRFINALIMGAANWLTTGFHGYYNVEIEKINPELISLYERIMALNEYLLFVTEEEMNDKHPKQGSYVEVFVGGNGKKSIIRAQGIIFPLLLHDTIKGLFELFSVHGLPKDKEKREYIIKKADFILAEPWDMRLGVPLWTKIFGTKIEEDNLLPYMFMYLVKLPYEEFNATMKEMLVGTEKGSEIFSQLMQAAQKNDGYQKFQKRINARNVDRSVIADSYFTASELDGFNIDGEDGDDHVIEELTESAENLDFPLYHYTFLKFLVEMLESGKFETSNRDIDYYKDDKIDGNYISGSKSRPYISFTRDKMYNVNMDKRWYDYGSKNDDLGPQVRIQFNPTFVKNVRYGRLQPYHYSDDYPDQREEKLFLGKNVESIPFDIRFVDKIDILARENTINESEPLLAKLASFPGVADKTNVYFVNYAASQRKIDKTTGDVLKNDNYKSYAKFLSGDENHAIPLVRLLNK